MSRIHDALKKAENERNRPDAVGLLPKPKNGNGHATDGSSEITSVLFKPHKAVACNARLLESCTLFEGTLDPSTMLSSDNSGYRIGAEEFRTLRSSLELVRKQHPVKTVMVTSPLPKEGKTFVAANLSQAIVWQHDQRVLLVDGDLRLPRIHSCFSNMPQEPGLADYLLGDVDPLSLLRRNKEGNFFVLPAGQSVPNALELIGNGRFKSLMDWLSPAFDWIVIDSPPCVPVSDSHLMAELCDAILFVVRAGATPSDMAKRAISEIRGNRYVGVVLNGVPPDLTASSYYYGGEQRKSHRRAQA